MLRFSYTFKLTTVLMITLSAINRTRATVDVCTQNIEPFFEKCTISVTGKVKNTTNCVLTENKIKHVFLSIIADRMTDDVKDYIKYLYKAVAKGYFTKNPKKFCKDYYDIEIEHECTNVFIENHFIITETTNSMVKIYNEFSIDNDKDVPIETVTLETEFDFLYAYTVYVPTTISINKTKLKGIESPKEFCEYKECMNELKKYLPDCETVEDYVSKIILHLVYSKINYEDQYVKKYIDHLYQQIIMKQIKSKKNYTQTTEEFCTNIEFLMGGGNFDAEMKNNEILTDSKELAADFVVYKLKKKIDPNNSPISYPKGVQIDYIEGYLKHFDKTVSIINSTTVELPEPFCVNEVKNLRVILKYTN